MRRLREAGDTVGTVIVHPEPGFEKVIAQELLALADSPYQVEYVMWPKPGFRVPEWLYEVFSEFQEKATELEENAATVIADVIAALETGSMPVFFEVPAEVAAQINPGEVIEVPAKRKPGRPKKNTEGQ